MIEALRFEVGYQLRHLATYVYFFLFFIFGVVFMSTDWVFNAPNDVYWNASLNPLDLIPKDNTKQISPKTQKL